MRHTKYLAPVHSCVLTTNRNPIDVGSPDSRIRVAARPQEAPAKPSERSLHTTHQQLSRTIPSGWLGTERQRRPQVVRRRMLPSSNQWAPLDLSRNKLYLFHASAVTIRRRSMQSGMRLGRSRVLTTVRTADPTAPTIDQCPPSMRGRRQRDQFARHRRTTRIDAERFSPNGAALCQPGATPREFRRVHPQSPERAALTPLSGGFCFAVRPRHPTPLSLRGIYR